MGESLFQDYVCLISGYSGKKVFLPAVVRIDYKLSSVDGGWYHFDFMLCSGTSVVPMSSVALSLPRELL